MPRRPFSTRGRYIFARNRTASVGLPPAENVLCGHSRRKTRELRSVHSQSTQTTCLNGDRGGQGKPLEHATRAPSPDLVQELKALVGVRRGGPKSVRLPGTDASWAGIVFYITKKARAPSVGPVGTSVVVDSRPSGHEAEEDVPRGSDNNSHVPVPHHQITRLRLRDLLKAFDSEIEIGGTGIGISKARSFVDGMNQMRTITHGALTNFRIKRGRDYRQTIVLAQGPIGLWCITPSRVWSYGAGCVTARRFCACPCQT